MLKWTSGPGAWACLAGSSPTEVNSEVVAGGQPTGMSLKIHVDFPSILDYRTVYSMGGTLKQTLKHF